MPGWEPEPSTEGHRREGAAAWHPKTATLRPARCGLPKSVRCNGWQGLRQENKWQQQPAPPGLKNSGAHHREIVLAGPFQSPRPDQTVLDYTRWPQRQQGTQVTLTPLGEPIQSLSDGHRLATALEKVRKAVTPKPISTRNARHIFLREGARSWSVSVDRIQLLESEGNYTRVYFEENRENRPLIYRSLSALQARLDPAVFFRVSRSHIVNVRKIVSLQRRAEGCLIATLPGGLEVNISRRRSRRLRQALSF